MQYVILSTTGYRTSDFRVSKYFSDAQILNSRDEVIEFAEAADCEEDELVIDANAHCLRGTVSDFSFRKSQKRHA